MDLCLPEDWRKHPQALCRDDLAPGFEPVLGGRVVYDFTEKWSGSLMTSVLMTPLVSRTLTSGYWP